MATIYRSAAGGRRIQDRYRELLTQWPVPSEQLVLPTSQGETFVIASGAREAPPLLLIHGSGANAAMWMRDVAGWAAHFRVYAVDVIGEPGLSAPARPPLASDAYVRWLDDVLAGLAVERTHLLGVSLGGWIALDHATRRPERIARLVLMCPAGVGRQRPSFLFKVVPLLLLGRWGRRRAMAIAAGPQTGTRDAALADFLMLIFTSFKPRREKLPIFGDDALRRLTMPVMLVAGGRDALLDSAGTLRRLQRLLPDLHARYLPEAGHIITGQTGAMLDFLRQASSGATDARDGGLLPQSITQAGRE